MKRDIVEIVAFYQAHTELEIVDPGDPMDFFGRLDHFPKTITELAEAVGITRRHVYNYIHSNEVGIRKRKIVDEQVLKTLTSLHPLVLLRLREAINEGEPWAIKEFYKVYGDVDSRVSAGQGDHNKMVMAGENHHDRVQLIMRDLVVNHLQEPEPVADAEYELVQDQDELISDIQSLLE